MTIFISKRKITLSYDVHPNDHIEPLAVYIRLHDWNTREANIIGEQDIHNISIE